MTYAMGTSALYIVNFLVIVYILVCVLKSYSESDLYISIGIISARNNLLQRRTIRETWIPQLRKNSSFLLEYKFIIGETCDIPMEHRVPFTCERRKVLDNDQMTNRLAIDLSETREVQNSAEIATALPFSTNYPIGITHLGILHHCLSSGVKLSVINDASDELVAEVVMDFTKISRVKEYAFMKIDDLNLAIGSDFSIEVSDTEQWQCNVTNYGLPKGSFDNGFITIHRHLGDPYSLVSRTPILNFIYDVKEELVTSRYSEESNENENYIIDKIVIERDRYNDLLIAPVRDVYRNIPKKLLYYLKTLSISRPKFVLKIDDDSYLNVARLLEKVEQLNNKRRVWWGNFRLNWAVNLYGKWKEFQYKSSAYPPFACGSGYVIDGELLDWIILNWEYLHPYQGEDVSMGIWLSAVAPELVHDSDWSCGQSCQTSAITVGELSPTRMAKIHKRLMETKELC